MLGYNSDLNEEFAQALAKFNSAKTAQEQCEHVAYLLRFLERYSLTHAPTKERAINSFMIHLVADAEKTQTALTAFEHGPEEANAADKLSYTIACDCLSSLVKLVDWNSTPGQSHPSSNFGELYLAHWDLNALLAVAFARQKGDEDNEFQEKPRLTLAQITQVLELAAIVRSKLDHPTQRGDDGAAVVGQIDRRWIYNAFALVNSILSPSRDDLLLVDHVLDMLHWLSVSSVDCFADVCRYAGLLKVFLAPLKPIFCGDELGGSVKDDAGNRAMEIFLTLVEMVVNTPPAEAEATASADEQLIDLLKFIYEQVDNNLRQESVEFRDPSTVQLGTLGIPHLSEDPELVSKLAAHGILETLCDQLLAYDQSTTQCKALGAMSRLVSAVDMDIDLLQSIIDNVVESVRRNVPVPAAHRVVGNALGVIITILKTGKNNQEHTQQQQRRPQSQQRQRKIEKSDAEINFRQVVLQRDGLRVALELLGATDSYVKLQAFIVVSEFVENHPDPMEVRELLLGSEEQGGSHALLSLVRVISDEARSTAAVTATDGLASSRNRDRTELLRVVLALLNMLITDDTLKMKLTPTTYDMVLQVVVATSTNPAPTSYQQRVLAESLKALTTMTRAGQIAELCPEAALVSSVDALVKVLRSSPAVAEISAGSTRNLLSPTNSSNTAARLNALFLLVNFASSALCRSRMARCGALEALLGIIQEPGGVSSVQDDQLVQLALLGVALMTTDGVTDAAAVVELSGAVDTLVRLLSSRSPSTQANAVWVVSNISSEDPKNSRKVHFERIVLQFTLVRDAFTTIRSIYRQFANAEKDGLDFEGLKAALNALGAEIKESDVSEIFYESDMVRDNSLSQNEFVVSLAIAHLLGLITNFDSIKNSLGHTPEDVTVVTAPDQPPLESDGGSSKLIAKALDLMVTAYLLFDNDASGTIQTNEVLAQMRQHSNSTNPGSHARMARKASGLPSKTIRDERIKELDFDQDGTITFQEFVLTFQRWAGSDDDDDDEEEE
ncbi:hypothetical protein PHYBOEH_011654 [Phytophthora boehmeriae]|uniref:EF-hand domain-containing protein n=1 Tax=Phytophthora boehmeriae TaxID=109152 RepID=A0A8T1XEB1_9STRA|nr:hypothetical protein PHYBOEH_011654 [Phytophthora boehmeriae]